jgi:hypothetical protein
MGKTEFIVALYGLSWIGVLGLYGAAVEAITAVALVTLGYIGGRSVVKAIVAKVTGINIKNGNGNGNGAICTERNIR